MKPKIIVVCGPTSTGKSDYAVKLAKQINGEIISADSRQVYIGMDIGSGKITQKEMKGIPHYMLDIASPKRTFSAAQYKKQAERCITKILKKGKTPIICGGTGFYIDALLGLEFPEVKPNTILRKKLEKQSTLELAKQLEKLDKDRYESIDIHNKVRLVRAIEIATALGHVPKVIQKTPYDVSWILLDMSDEKLKERIEKRLLARLKKGMITEVQKLHTSGVSFQKLESFGLEYKYCALYLQKKISKKDMIEAIKTTSWQYVKRQRTWLKRNKQISYTWI